LAHHLVKEQNYAYGNCRVGHIKSGPMPVIPMEIKEIDHFPLAQTVNQVTYGAA
jgi:hypothetical protein